MTINSRLLFGVIALACGVIGLILSLAVLDYPPQADDFKAFDVIVSAGLTSAGIALVFPWR